MYEYIPVTRAPEITDVTCIDVVFNTDQYNWKKILSPLLVECESL
jgi:hypothetical protein